MLNKKGTLIPSGIVINIICKRLLVAANELKKTNKKMLSQIKGLADKGLYWPDTYKSIHFITSKERDMRRYIAILSDNAKKYSALSFDFKTISYVWQKIRKLEVKEGKKKLLLFEVGYGDCDTAYCVAANQQQANLLASRNLVEFSLRFVKEVSINDYCIGFNVDKNVLTTKWWIDYLNQLTDNYFTGKGGENNA